MKTKNFILLLAAVVLSSLVYSCSNDSSTEPSSTNLSMSDYFPTTAGSWWKYQNYELDSLGNRISEDEIDSVFVGQKMTIEDKEAVSLITANEFEGEIYYDTTFYHISGSKLYIFEQGFDETKEKEWILFVDLNQNKWQIMHMENHIDSTMFNPIDSMTYNIKSDEMIDATGYQNGNKEYEVNGNNIQAKGIKMLITMEYYYKMNDEEESDSAEAEFLQWFGKSVGMVHNLSEEIDGNQNKHEAILIDYFIAQ